MSRLKSALHPKRVSTPSSVAPQWGLSGRRWRRLRVDISDGIATDRIINELMGKDASARFRFIMDRAEEVEELDV